MAELWRTVKVERSDPYTVRFTFAEPFAPSLHYTTIGPLPAHLLKDVPAKALADHPFNLHPVGTGPFQLSEVTAQHALLRAYPDAYGGRPYLDGIEFISYPDYASVFGASRCGEVDGISRVAPEDLDEAAADANLNLYLPPWMAMLLSSSTWSGPSCRKRSAAGAAPGHRPATHYRPDSRWTGSAGQWSGHAPFVGL